MRKFLVALALLTMSSPAFAARDNGFGVMIGDPTGLSYKHWFSASSAFDVGLGWNLVDGVTRLIADYHIVKPGLIRISSELFDLYFGPGLRLFLGGNTSLGVRIPVGIDYRLRSDPLGFFLEVVPVVTLAPATAFDMDFSIGARYLF